MSLYDEIVAKYPELLKSPDIFGFGGSIGLRDDSDDKGEYIEKWEYEKPIPSGMKLGK